MADLSIYESGQGGEIAPGNNLYTSSLWNMIYIALFGGNPGEITPRVRASNEQAFDYWANALLIAQDKAAQFNSLTEHTLNTTALSSSGRLAIEQSAKKDLEFMQAFAEVSVSVSIDLDRVHINIKVQEPEAKQALAFTYIWDATRNEAVTDHSLGIGVNALGIDYYQPDYSPEDYY